MGIKEFVRTLFAPPPPPPPPPPPRGKQIIKLPSPLQRDENGLYDVVCPFCMERYHVWELEFRSLSVDDGEGDGYPIEIDEKYVSFWDNVRQPTQTPEQNFVLNITDRENVTEVYLWDGTRVPNTAANQELIAKKAIWQVKDKFGNIATQRICPCCHNKLPDVIGRSPNYIISMMGNTLCGKTVYLSRLLLSLLNNELLPDWGLSVDIVQTDPTRPQSRPAVKRSLERMFSGERDADRESGRLAEATPIRYMHPTILKLQRGHEHTLLTLFDFPGEAIWKLKSNERVYFQQLMHRMNENANGWLFLLDSTMLEPVYRNILSNGDEEYLAQTDPEDANLNADPESVLLEFSNFFGSGNQIKPPVAFVFSKADMIARYAEQLRGEGYQIASDSPFLNHTPHVNRSKVDLDDLWKCDHTLQKFLGKDQVLKTAGNLCRRYAWFAASATGVPVKSGRMGNTMSSAYRVVEPLEWLLWMLGAYAGEYTYGNPLWGVSAKQDSDKG